MKSKEEKDLIKKIAYCPTHKGAWSYKCPDCWRHLHELDKYERLRTAIEDLYNTCFKGPSNHPDIMVLHTERGAVTITENNIWWTETAKEFTKEEHEWLKEHFERMKKR